MLINLVSMHVSSSCKWNFGNVINVSRRNIARTFPSFLIFFFFLKLFNFEKTCINLNRLKELILFLLILLTKIFLINIKSIPIIHIRSVDIFLFDLYVENYYSFFSFLSMEISTQQFDRTIDFVQQVSLVLKFHKWFFITPFMVTEANIQSCYRIKPLPDKIFN